ncbi:hypothetical protein MPSEU_001103100 [Mayamaea pseudoterrestris]|nr:hypothetical protein MPSEU_001103100 [Mayamaea pseudoterrestris]
MSKVLLRQSKIAPKLIYEACHDTRVVQVWTTPCIVTRFGKPNGCCSILVNPSNPELSGCRNFPYFPKGGPVPAKVDSMHKDWQPLGFVSQWGGMEVGSGMLFPVSVVDGLVHQLGGWTLQAEIAVKRLVNSQPCPVGRACRTTAGQGKLRDEYDEIIHTTPPFYKHDKSPEQMLSSCYESALRLAFEHQETDMGVAIPLLGAGARGFPTNIAIDVAAKSAVAWCRSDNKKFASRSSTQRIAFGLLEDDDAKALSEAIDLELKG